MLNRFIRILYRLLYFVFNSRKYKFLSMHAYVQKLLRIDGKENITIEKNVVIQSMSWLAALPLTNSDNCNLIIREGSIVGHFNHIFATGLVEIGKNVLLADKVYISDNQHVYDDVNTPVMFQGVKQLGKVKIGDGSWIGENVSIIGASVGKNCVIGSNSVVTKDIPDFSIAVGVPAKVIKRFDFDSSSWKLVH